MSSNNDYEHTNDPLFSSQLHPSSQFSSSQPTPIIFPELEAAMESTQPLESTQELTATQQLDLNNFQHSPSIPDPDKLARSWGYLKPFRGDVGCVYFWEGTESYVFGRLDPNLNRKAGEGNRDSNEVGFIVIGRAYKEIVEKKVKENVFDKKRRAYIVKEKTVQKSVTVHEGVRISREGHCKISWNKAVNGASAVTVYDMSRNGTFINKVPMKQFTSRLLRDGEEIAFGKGDPVPGGEHDWRYIFHFTKVGLEKGIKAEYDISGELGKGTFATVYKALHGPSNKWYAIKSIRRDRMPGDRPRNNGNRRNINREKEEDERVQERIVREVAILQSLHHDNIVRLKDIWEDVDGVHIVMEYAEGGDLLARIVREKGLQENLARHITYQACLALSYVHSLGIVHRDIKPENILLTKSDPPVVKIADFGLAKAAHSSTQLRTTCGTPTYLAPEIVLNEDRRGGGYTAAVDCFSLGIVVYCMLVCAVPYTEDPALPREDRVKARVFDYDSLVTKIGPTNSVLRAFIARLVNDIPDDRMTMKEALYHDWLLDLTEAKLAREEAVPGGYISDDAGRMTVVAFGFGSQSDEAMREEKNEDSMVVDVKGEGEGSQSQSFDIRGKVPGAYPESQSLSDTYANGNGRREGGKTLLHGRMDEGGESDVGNCDTDVGTDAAKTDNELDSLADEVKRGRPTAVGANARANEKGKGRKRSAEDNVGVHVEESATAGSPMEEDSAPEGAKRMGRGRKRGKTASTTKSSSASTSASVPRSSSPASGNRSRGRFSAKDLESSDEVSEECDRMDVEPSVSSVSSVLQIPIPAGRVTRRSARLGRA